MLNDTLRRNMSLRINFIEKLIFKTQIKFSNDLEFFHLPT